jgi:hypothetical protein
VGSSTGRSLVGVMSEPLKNSFGPDVPARIAAALATFLRRFTAEFSIRAFLEHREAETLAQLREWAGDSNHQVRRLVSESTRPRLPWAPRLRRFQGDAGALAVLGFGAESPATLRSVTCTPAEVEIGGKVRIEIQIQNPSADELGVLVDLRVHFVKANGSVNPKVFKGAEIRVGPGATVALRKTISLKQHTTRKHFAGTHAVDVLINGRSEPGNGFRLR